MSAVYEFEFQPDIPHLETILEAITSWYRRDRVEARRCLVSPRLALPWPSFERGIHSPFGLLLVQADSNCPENYGVLLAGPVP